MSYMLFEVQSGKAQNTSDISCVQVLSLTFKVQSNEYELLVWKK